MKFRVLFVALIGGLLFGCAKSNDSAHLDQIDLINQIQFKIRELEEIEQPQLIRRELFELINDLRFDELASDDVTVLVKNYVNSNFSKQLNSRYFERIETREKELQERLSVAIANQSDQALIAYSASDSVAPNMTGVAVFVASSAKSIAKSDNDQGIESNAIKAVAEGMQAASKARVLAKANPTVAGALILAETSVVGVQRTVDSHNLILLEDSKLERELEAIRSEIEHDREAILAWIDSIVSQAHLNSVDDRIVRPAQLDAFFEVRQKNTPRERLAAMEFLAPSVTSLPQCKLLRAETLFELGEIEKAASIVDDIWRTQADVLYSEKFLREALRLKIAFESDPYARKKGIQDLLSMKSMNDIDMLFAANTLLEIGDAQNAAELARSLFTAGKQLDAAALILVKSSAREEDMELLSTASHSTEYHRILAGLFGREFAKDGFSASKESFAFHYSDGITNDKIELKINDGWDKYFAWGTPNITATSEQSKLTLNVAIEEDKQGGYIAKIPAKLVGKQKLNDPVDLSLVIDGLPTSMTIKVRFILISEEKTGLLGEMQNRASLNRKRTLEVKEICTLSRCLVNS